MFERIPTAMVKVVPGDHGVLVFHTWRNKIPEGVKVIHACGAPVAHTAPEVEVPFEGEREIARNARFAFNAFVDLCLIDSVIVSEDANGCCHIYVNWHENHARAENVCWKNDTYRNFLRSLFNETYKNVKLKFENGKTSLRFSDKRAKGPIGMKIVFSRAHVDAAQAQAD